MQDGTWFVMFRNRDVTLDDATDFLRRIEDWHVTVDGGTADRPWRAVVVEEGGVSIGITLHEGTTVLQESQEIATSFGAGRSDQAQIAACDRRFGIAYELRPDMANFNLLCAVENQLKTLLAEEAFTFMAQAGEFL